MLKRIDVRSHSYTVLEVQAMSTKAYEKINESTKLNMEIEKDAEQAAAFADIMRRWSSKAYESVDKETEKASEDKKKRLDMASKLRSMNPGAYEQLDTVAKAEFHKGKGVSWTDSSGVVHDTPLVKKKMQNRSGNFSDLPPSDPYRADAP